MTKPEREAVRAGGDPDLIAAVESGKMSVSAAAKKVKATPYHLFPGPHIAAFSHVQCWPW